MLDSQQLASFQDTLTGLWHQPENTGETSASDPWLELVARQHRANFELWHIEDEARDPKATDAQMASTKRRIDHTNQLRNDLVEQLDLALLGWLEERKLPHPAAPLHSETAGLIIDRLSILSLKIFHTREQAERTDAPEGHQQRNLDRLAVLEAQRRDLTQCLAELWDESLAGRRRFKLYRQMKMYNDPSLNPAIYGKKDGSPPIR
jgi:hypothetical protein